MTKEIIGVDPGANGAIASLDAETGDLLWVEDMPSHDGVVSPANIADMIDGRDVVVAWIEKVHSMPKQGVSSSFKFGRAFGTVIGALGGNRIPIQYVTPAKWKADARLSKDKNASRQRATELWPGFSAEFKRVKDNDRAEAALIARHGWLLRHGLSE